MPLNISKKSFLRRSLFFRLLLLSCTAGLSNASWLIPSYSDIFQKVYSQLNWNKPGNDNSEWSRYRPQIQQGNVEQGVNTFTGQYSFALPLGVVKSGAIEYPLSIQYSSSPDVMGGMPYWEAPRTLVGWDWSFTVPFIQRETRGTKTIHDDVFWCNLGPWGGGELLIKQIENNTASFVLSTNPLLTIYVTYHASFDATQFNLVDGDIEAFRVALPSGLILNFGGTATTIRSASLINERLEDGAGVVNERLAYRWDIFSVYDGVGKTTVEFSWQPQQPGTNEYTSNSLLRSISARDIKGQFTSIATLSYGCHPEDTECNSTRWLPEDILGQRPLEQRQILNTVRIEDRSRYNIMENLSVLRELKYSGLHGSQQRPLLLEVTSKLNGHGPQVEQGSVKFSYGYAPKVLSTDVQNIRLNKIDFPNGNSTQIDWENVLPGTDGPIRELTIAPPSFWSGSSLFWNPEGLVVDSWCENDICFVTTKKANGTFLDEFKSLSLHAWRIESNRINGSELPGFPIEYKETSSEWPVPIAYQSGVFPYDLTTFESQFKDFHNDYSIVRGNGWFLVVDRHGLVIDVFERKGDAFEKTILPDLNSFLNSTEKFSHGIDVYAGEDYFVVKRSAISVFGVADGTHRRAASQIFANVDPVLAVFYRKKSYENGIESYSWASIYREDSGDLSKCEINNTEWHGYGVSPRLANDLVQPDVCLVWDTDIQVQAGSDYFTVVHSSRHVVYVYRKLPNGGFEDWTDKIPLMADHQFQWDDNPMVFESEKPVVSAIPGSPFLQILSAKDESIQTHIFKMGSNSMEHMGSFYGEKSVNTKSNLITFDREYEAENSSDNNYKKCDLITPTFTLQSYTLLPESQISANRNWLDMLLHNSLGCYEWENQEDNEKFDLVRTDGNFEFTFLNTYGENFTTAEWKYLPKRWWLRNSSDEAALAARSQLSWNKPSRPNLRMGVGTKIFKRVGRFPLEIIQSRDIFGPGFGLASLEAKHSGLYGWSVMEAEFQDKECSDNELCNFSPVIVNQNLGMETSAQISEAVKNVHPWNVDFFFDEDKAFIAKVSLFTGELTVWIARNVNGAYFSMKPTPVVKRVTTTFPEQSTNPSYLEFEYGVNGHIGYNSRLQAMNSGATQIQRGVVLSPTSRKLLTESLEQYRFENDQNVLVYEDKNLTGTILRRVDHNWITGAKTDASFYDVAHHEDNWINGIYMNRRESELVLSVDPQGNSIGTETKYQKFNKDLLPEFVVRTQSNVPGFDVLQRKYENHIYITGIGADKPGIFVWPVLVGEYRFKFLEQLPILSADDVPAPLITESNPTQVILSGATYTWSKYPGRKISTSEWVDPFDDFASDFSSDIFPLYKMNLATWVTTQSVAYDDRGNPTQVQSFTNAQSQYTSVIYDPNFSQPLVGFENAKASNVAAFIPEDICATRVGFVGAVCIQDISHSGERSEFLAQGAEVFSTELLSELNVGDKIQVSGWALPRNGEVPKVRLEFVDNSGNVLASSSSPDIVPMRTWHKLQTSLGIPRICVDEGCKARATIYGTALENKGFYLDDFVIAPEKATYSIYGYDGFGRNISIAPNGDNVVWIKRDYFGRETGSADSEWRIFNQVSHQRAMENR